LLAQLSTRRGCIADLCTFGQDKLGVVAATMTSASMRAIGLQLGDFGRGKPYQTTLGATAYGDGFVLPLVYGRQCDWCQNALAAGKATLA